MTLLLIGIQAVISVILISKASWGIEYSALLVVFGMLNVLLGTRFVKGEE